MFVEGKDEDAARASAAESLFAADQGLVAATFRIGEFELENVDGLGERSNEFRRLEELAEVLQACGAPVDEALRELSANEICPGNQPDAA